MDPFDAAAPQTPAGRRILAAASELFYERGIHAVGVDTVAEVAGTTKKTIYDRFGSKDALVAAYLAERARLWQQHLLSTCARRRPGVRRVAGVFDAIESWLAGSTRGCAFVNAYAEYGDRADHPAIEVVRAEKRWMRDYFVEQVQAVGLPATTVERLGRMVHLLYEGALVASTAGGDLRAVPEARSAAVRLLDLR